MIATIAQNGTAKASESFPRVNTADPRPIEVIRESVNLKRERLALLREEAMLEAAIFAFSGGAISVASVIEVTATIFGIAAAEIRGKRRPESIAHPRQAAMYVSRLCTRHSLEEIGKEMGGKDHGTVMHAIRAVKDRMEVNPEYRAKVHMVLSKCRELELRITQQVTSE